ncbi:hypothetical protein ABIE12_001924 [Serratia sp. 509]
MTIGVGLKCCILLSCGFLTGIKCQFISTIPAIWGK